jgi:hypothetical protein
MVGLVVAACGKGAPGGFSAVGRSSSATVSVTRNTAAQGVPVAAPVTSLPAEDTKITVTLAKGTITLSVKEVRAHKLSFVVSNDDDIDREVHVASVTGTALASIDRVKPGDVRTLSVEIGPGRYGLVAEGGGKPPMSAGFTVSS